MSMWGDIEQDWKPDTPGTLEERLRTTRLLSQRNQMALQAEAADEIARLYSLARANNDLARRHADEIASLRARVEAMREALEAISVSGIHRDTKWFGMRAHDIALQTLKDTPG